MRYILYSIICLLLFVLFCFNKKIKADTNSQLTKYENDDYSIYDEKIRAALNSQSSNTNYSNTFKAYRIAFKCVSSPLAVDVLDALNIAIEADSIDAMYEFSEILVKKGCSYSFFEREELEKIKQYPNRWTELSILIDEVRANPNNYWNVELKEKLEALYRKDQFLANKYKDRDKYKGAWCLETEYQKDVKLPFLKLIKEYGLKGEKELGVYIIDENHGLIQVFPVTIMIHIVQSGESRFTNDEIDSYYRQGYIPKLQADYIKNNITYQNRIHYKKTNEMIRRGAPEDSITIQVREERMIRLQRQ